MEPVQTPSEIQTPRWSRGISWLGGASFGRSPKRTDTPTPHTTYGTVPLVLLHGAFVATFQFRGFLGPWPSLIITLAGIALCGLWLKRYHAATVPFYRWATYTMLAVQIVLNLPIYIRAVFSEATRISLL